MGMMNASAPDPAGVVLCNPFKWEILMLMLIENHVISVPSTPAKWISFRNHKNRKVVGGKNNVLVLYVDPSAPNPSGVVLWDHFIWSILYSFLIKNHVQKSWFVFVPSTPAKWISFCNHKNRKVVGGKHNVLVHYVCGYLVLSSETLSNEIFCCSFWLKIMLFLCLPHQQNEFHSPTIETEQMLEANTMY